MSGAAGDEADEAARVRRDAAKRARSVTFPKNPVAGVASAPRLPPASDADLPRSASASSAASASGGAGEGDGVKRASKTAVGVMLFQNFLASLVFSIVLPSLWPFLNKLNRDEVWVGWAVAVNSAGSFVSSPLLGFWNDRRSTREVMGASLIVMAVGNLVYVLADGAIPDVTDVGNTYILMTARFLVGFAAGNFAVVQTYFSYATKPSVRTMVMSLNSGTSVLGFIIGPALATVMSDKVVGTAVIGDPKGFHVNVNELTLPGMVSAVLSMFALASLYFVTEVPRDAVTKEPVDVSTADEIAEAAVAQARNAGASTSRASSIASYMEWATLGSGYYVGDVRAAASQFEPGRRAKSVRHVSVADAERQARRAAALRAANADARRGDAVAVNGGGGTGAGGGSGGVAAAAAQSPHFDALYAAASAADGGGRAATWAALPNNTSGGGGGGGDDDDDDDDAAEEAHQRAVLAAAAAAGGSIAAYGASGRVNPIAAPRTRVPYGPVSVVLYLYFCYCTSFTVFETVGVVYTKASPVLQFDVSSNGGFFCLLGGECIVGLLLLQVVNRFCNDRLLLVVTTLLMSAGNGMLLQWDGWAPAWRFYVGVGMVSVGYSTSTALLISIYSKVLEGLDQGVMMGWLSSAAAIARLVGPLASAYVWKLDTHGNGHLVFVGITALLFVAAVVAAACYGVLRPHVPDGVANSGGGSAAVKGSLNSERDPLLSGVGGDDDDVV